jgi:hypothetical protein
MNFTNMQNQVRILLGETSSTDTYFTDTEVQDQINRAQQELAMDTEALLTYCDFTLTASTQSYQVPDNALKIVSIYLLPTGQTSRWEKLIYLTHDEFEAVSYGGSDNEAEPLYYKLEIGAVEISNNPQIQGDIWLYPIPNAADKLRVRHYRKPATLSTGTEISLFPEGLHMALCYKAAEELAMKGKDYELMRLLNQKFETSVTKYVSYIKEDQLDRNMTVKDTMGYGMDIFDSFPRNRR